MTAPESPQPDRRIPSAAEVRGAAAKAEAEAALLEVGTPEWRTAYQRVLELHRMVLELEKLEASS